VRLPITREIFGDEPNLKQNNKCKRKELATNFRFRYNINKFER